MSLLLCVVDTVAADTGVVYPVTPEGVYVIRLSAPVTLPHSRYRPLTIVDAGPRRPRPPFRLKPTSNPTEKTVPDPAPKNAPLPSARHARERKDGDDHEEKIVLLL